MYINIPEFKINTDDYKHFISIGNKCLSRMVLDKYKLSNASYPFDWVPTQPHLIIKYLQDHTNYLPDKPFFTRNKDNVWFGHFDLSKINRKELEDKFNRRFNRFKDTLKNGEKILFLYTTEADIYNELGSLVHKDLNYINLKVLIKYLQSSYPKSNFDLLCIHTNDERPCENINNTTIYNYTVYVPIENLSLSMETHTNDVIQPYRKMVEESAKLIFYGIK